MTEIRHLGQFLTRREIDRVLAIRRNTKPGTFAQRVANEVISPVIDRINKQLGQEMDPKYLAYVVEHFVNEVERAAKRHPHHDLP